MMNTDEKLNTLKQLRESPDFASKVFSNGVSATCAGCREADLPNPRPAEWAVSGIRQLSSGRKIPFKKYLCESHVDHMADDEDGEYKIKTCAWKPGLQINRSTADKITNSLTGYTGFLDLCRNYPDLTYRQDLFGKGKKFSNWKLLCKFYEQATGCKPYCPLYKGGKLTESAR